MPPYKRPSQKQLDADQRAISKSQGDLAKQDAPSIPELIVRKVEQRRAWRQAGAVGITKSQPQRAGAEATDDLSVGGRGGAMVGFRRRPRNTA